MASLMKVSVLTLCIRSVNPFLINNFAARGMNGKFSKVYSNKNVNAEVSNLEDSFHLDTNLIYETKSSSLENYKAEYERSIEDPSKYWYEKALEYLDWFIKPTSSLKGSLLKGDVTYFANGKLNICYNAVDRHPSDKLALIYESDEPDFTKKYTFGELLIGVSQIANTLVEEGVKEGDVVTLYMPMNPYLVMTMLACARIGAIHSVVFGGFSAEALASRIVSSSSKFVVTGKVGRRGGKALKVWDIVQDALHKLTNKDLVEKVFLYEELSAHSSEQNEVNIDSVYQDLIVEMSEENLSKQRPYCPPVVMDAESPLFILFTSGSTGAPKGLLHTTGGYALYAAMTTHRTFGIKEDDIFACVADCGWITGHSYVTYGPLLNGITTTIFESTPVYPNAGRYWDMVQRHKINIFYTSPTAVRLLMKYGEDIPRKYDLSSLRVLGSVGEPINPEAWNWYYKVVGREQCSVVDTYWQTETGGHIMTPQANITPLKPGSCTFPFYGIEPILLDPQTGQPIEGTSVHGVLAFKTPWPGMARTCFKNHDRYLSVYLQPYKGYYFTGDSAYRDQDGYYWITGRVDDVLNVSGHRIGTADVEGALVNHISVAQAAAVGCEYCLIYFMSITHILFYK